MAAIILLCLFGLVLILGTALFVRASRRDIGDQRLNQFVSGAPTDPIHHMRPPTNDTTNIGTEYPFPKTPYHLGPQIRDNNEASYRETEYPKEENVGDLPWD